MDITKFFDNVSHEKLIECLKRRISDPVALGLLGTFIKSYETVKFFKERERERELTGKFGIPTNAASYYGLLSRLEPTALADFAWDLLSREEWKSI